MARYPSRAPAIDGKLILMFAMTLVSVLRSWLHVYVHAIYRDHKVEVLLAKRPDLVGPVDRTRIR